jgi:protein-tyrosine phosphatase
VNNTIINRQIRLEVAHNVRHIGGYPTRTGRETRPDIIRAGSLHRLTGAGVQSLVQLGVATVVDLRSDAELETLATPGLAAAGIRQVHAPVFKADASPAALAKEFTGFLPVYKDFLDSGRPAYRSLFDTVAESDGAVVFHCAAGKDRTGIAAALMLDLAGVADEDIVEDYAVSASLLEGAFKDWEATEEQKKRAAELGPETVKLMLGSEPEYIVDTLDYIRGRWGSSEGYLATELGLDAPTITRLRNRLVA